MNPPPGTLPAGTAGVFYSQLFQTSGLTQPISWSVTAGSLPHFTITVQGTNVEFPNPVSCQFNYNLTVNPGVLSITSGTLPSGAAAGGTQPYSWSTISGTLPPRLNLGTASSTNQPLIGTPTTGGLYSFTIQVTGGQTASRQINILIQPPPPTITTAGPLPSGTVGTPYGTSFTVLNGAGPFTWSIVAGQVPPGLSMGTPGPTSVPYSGTPTLSQFFTLTLQVVDALGRPATKQFDIDVQAPPFGISTTSPLPNGTAGVAYSTSLTVVNGTAPYVWSISAGALPPGVAPGAPLVVRLVDDCGDPVRNAAMTATF
ncbi:MAG: hypothetical protein ABIZ80_18505 [Bryobacteraceae bacterium]